MSVHSGLLNLVMVIYCFGFKNAPLSQLIKSK